MVKRFLLSTAILGAAGMASAEVICQGGPRDQWLGEAEIVAKLNALGHADFDLSIEDGCIAATVETPKGEVEYFFEPITGDLAAVRKS